MSNTRIRNNRMAPQSDYRNVQSRFDSSIVDAKEYKDNELAIEKLMEERELAFAESSDLKGQLEILLIKHHRLEIQKKEIDVKLNEANSKIVKLTDLENKLEDLRVQSQATELNKRELEIKLEVANQKLDAIRQNALLNFVTTTLGAVLFTLGTDI